MASYIHLELSQCRVTKRPALKMPEAHPENLDGTFHRFFRKFLHIYFVEWDDVFAKTQLYNKVAIFGISPDWKICYDSYGGQYKHYDYDKYG